MNRGGLAGLFFDETVNEVMVNGDGRVWVEREGRVVPAGFRLQRPEVALLIEQIVAPLGLRVDRSSPMVDARLSDGSRVNAVVAPLAVDGPCVTVRRFRTRPLPLSAWGPPRLCALLEWLVESRANLLVSGATGSGKTTLLNGLASHITTGERIITIEDAAELRLPQDHVIRLEARPANAEGAGAVTVRDLVRNALRMRPDRIVVGEVRGAEALDMLQAMSTGHDGSLSTCHANRPADALRRVEAMALQAGSGLPLVAIRDQLHAAVDVVVQVARMAGGRRAVTGVGEVLEDPDDRRRVRLLAEDDRVLALPGRDRRWAGAPEPNPSWVTS